jgi:hypothetical protein
MSTKAPGHPVNAGETSMARALAPFGWVCGPEFWKRYYSDAWVFNLANAVERLSAEVDRLNAESRTP